MSTRTPAAAALLPALAALFCAGQAAAAVAVRELSVVAGLQTIVDIDFEPCGAVDECIRIANRGLMAVQYAPSQKQIILTPVKRGETTITVRDSRGNVRLVLNALVTDVNLPRLEAELRDLFKGVSGVVVRTVADKILVDGDVASPAGFSRVRRVLADPSYKDVVLDLTTGPRRGPVGWGFVPFLIGVLAGAAAALAGVAAWRSRPAGGVRPTLVESGGREKRA